MIEISQTSLSQIETGTTRPSQSTLIKICDKLEVSEVMLYILGSEETDVPISKKKIYEKLFPEIEKLFLDTYIK